MSRPFAARYAGTCAACSERWAPGDQIAYSTDDELVHVACPEVLDPMSDAALDKEYGPVCQRCWLRHPADWVACP